MPVNFSYRSSVNVNAVATKVPTFNFLSCALIGVFSNCDGFGSGIYKIYEKYQDVETDFLPCLLATNTIRVNDRIAWLIGAAKKYFNQKPQPANLIICKLEPIYVEGDGTLPEYMEGLKNIFDNAPSFYACSLVDTILYDSQTEYITEFINSFNANIKNARRSILFANCNHPFVPYLTREQTDVSLYNASCRASENLNADIDTVITLYHSAHYPQGAGGGGSDQDASGNYLIFFDTNNINLNTQNLSAAAMGAFFTDPFGKSLADVLIYNSEDDILVTSQTIYNATFNIDTKTGNFANVLANYTLQKNKNFKLIQYGTMASSTANRQLYLDQMITRDYAELYTEQILAEYAINNNLYFDDAGIAQCVAQFKAALQLLVNANMILPFQNNDISFPKMADILTDPTYLATSYANRNLVSLSANITFSTHIQKSKITVNVNLA